MAEAVRRDQTAHERLIPLLVEILGARSYLELGTHANETISKVACERRYGVDIDAVDCDGARMFRMTTERFFSEEAAALAPFDFIFIDADHALQAVGSDFAVAWGFLAEDGIIALHDTNPETEADTAPGYCDSAWKFPMFLAGAGVEAVTLPFHPGLTIVRKRMHWGPVP